MIPSPVTVEDKLLWSDVQKACILSGELSKTSPKETKRWSLVLFSGALDAPTFDSLGQAQNLISSSENGNLNKHFKL